MAAWIINIIVIGAGILGALILGKIFKFISEKYIKKIFEKTKTEIDDKILVIINRNIYLFFLLVSGKISSALVNYHGFTKARAVVDKTLNIAIIVLVALMAIKVVDAIIEEMMKKRDGRINSIIIPLFQNVGRISIWIIAAGMIVIELGYSPLSLLTGMGIAGVAVSFAAQNTISNFLSGVFIMVDGPFSFGDRIKIGEYVGDVIEIGMRNTKIKTVDNLIVTIPNSKLTSTEVSNFSKPTSAVRVVQNIGVEYGSDVARAKEVIFECVKNTEGVLKEPEYGVFFTKFGNFGLEFEIVFFIENFADKSLILDRFNFLIDRRFREAGINIPYPTYKILQ